MNLELIKEIESLKGDRKTYTEIAEITGLARSSIVLSLRLSKIFHTAYTENITSLNSEIEVYKSNAEKFETLIAQQKEENQLLSELVEIDYKRYMVVAKDEFKNLEDELEKQTKEVGVLTRKLHYQKVHLNNLSFTDKMKLLFS